MKRLLLALMVLFVSLNFIACAEKKDSKTRLTQGNGRGSGVYGAPNTDDPAINSAWNDLNNGPEQDLLNSTDPDQTARSFIPNNSEYGHFDYNSVVMRLTFNSNGSIVPQRTRLGMRFWDNPNNPAAYLVGTETGASITGTNNNGVITVVFKDSAGDITVTGRIVGTTFVGKVTFDGGNFLGNFDLTASASIYRY